VITALEAVRSGQCTAVCLIAGEVTCECRCRGLFHGALADAEVKPAPARCGALPPPDKLWCSVPTGVSCELPAGHPPVLIHHHGGYGSWNSPVDDGSAGDP